MSKTKTVDGHLNDKQEWQACGGPCKTIEERVFVCVMPTCLSYSDRCIQENGDYRTLGRLFFDTLDLWTTENCSNEIRTWIRKDANRYKVGQVFETSACGQTIVLGHRKCAGLFGGLRNEYSGSVGVE